MKKSAFNAAIERNHLRIQKYTVIAIAIWLPVIAIGVGGDYLNWITHFILLFIFYTVMVVWMVYSNVVKSAEELKGLIYRYLITNLLWALVFGAFAFYQLE